MSLQQTVTVIVLGLVIVYVGVLLIHFYSVWTKQEETKAFARVKRIRVSGEHGMPRRSSGRVGE